MKIGLLAVFLVCLFEVIFLPPKTYSAFTINNVAPTTIKSTEDIITVSASASGLQSSSQYLQVLWTKESEAVDYFGLTRNLTDEWFVYKSSPTTSDLATYFYSFVPLSGNWSGQLEAKIDPADSGFKGQGNYLIKLAKYITSSPSYSNSVPVAVNISLLSPTPTPVVVSKASYKINEVKNSGGEVLSNVQIYIDDNYSHHYAPETFTFCDDCDYNFGSHVVALKKSGYLDWSETKTLESGSSFEVNPVLVINAPSPTPWVSPTKVPSQTPTSIPTPTKIISPSPTIGLKPEILGTESADVITPTAIDLKMKVSPDFYSPVLIAIGGLLSFVGVTAFLVVKYKGGL